MINLSNKGQILASRCQDLDKLGLDVFVDRSYDPSVKKDFEEFLDTTLRTGASGSRVFFRYSETDATIFTNTSFLIGPMIVQAVLYHSYCSIW